MLCGSPMHDVLMSEMPKLGIKRHSERPSRTPKGVVPGTYRLRLLVLLELRAAARLRD